MTAPIIPADQWPDTVVAKLWTSTGECWDLAPYAGGWALGDSSTPMPAGWDWRVPVMRQQCAAPVAVVVDQDTAYSVYPYGIKKLGGAAPLREGTLLYAAPQPAPAIDLGQYAVAVQYAINGLLESGCKTDSVVAKKLRSLLALIDGQATKGEGE